MQSQSTDTCACGCGQQVTEGPRYIRGHRFGRTPEQRFWQLVAKSPDCWVWTGRRNPSGRGQFGDRPGHIVLAPRFSWELHFGSIPQGLYVCHHCDNPSCVRPDHLFLGTQQDNVRDSMAKGRFMTEKRLAAAPRGDDHYARQRPGARRGEASGRSARLTWVKAREIRALYATGDMTLEALGVKYGVCFQTISLIVNNKTWIEG